MDKFLSTFICVFGLSFISACADHVIQVRRIEQQSASLPEFSPGNWKIELSSAEPVVSVVDGVEHIDFVEGAKLTLVRR